MNIFSALTSRRVQPGQRLPQPSAPRWLRAALAAVVATVTATIFLPVGSVSARPVAPSQQAPAGAAGEVVATINAERSARGLAPLANVGGGSAQCAAETFRDTSNPHPGGCGTVGFQASVATNKGARSAVRAWMNSDGHRKIIVNPGGKRVRVGVACAANGMMFVVAEVEYDNPLEWDNRVPSASPVVTSNGGSTCQVAPPPPPPPPPTAPPPVAPPTPGGNTPPGANTPTAPPGSTGNGTRPDDQGQPDDPDGGAAANEQPDAQVDDETSTSPDATTVPSKNDRAGKDQRRSATTKPSAGDAEDEDTTELAVATSNQRDDSGSAGTFLLLGFLVVAGLLAAAVTVAWKANWIGPGRTSRTSDEASLL